MHDYEMRSIAVLTSLILVFILAVISQRVIFAIVVMALAYPWWYLEYGKDVFGVRK